MAGGDSSSLLKTAAMIGVSIAAPELAPAFLTEGVGATAAAGLTGAALSGGIQALTGGNVAQGVLMGGLGGALAGYNGGLSPTDTAVNTAQTVTADAGTTAQQAYDAQKAAQTLNPANWGEAPTTLQTPQQFLNQANFSNLSSQTLSGLQNAVPGAADASSIINSAGQANQALSAQQMSSLAPLGSMGNALGAAISAHPMYTIGGLGLLGAYANQPNGLNPANTATPNYLPTYTGAQGVNPQASKMRWNNPTALGYPQYAGGGTVEEMSRQNATGSNQMYPQANLSGLTGMNTYQNPTNTPMSSNVIGPTDTPTDPYTGAMRFAGGGDIGAIDQEKVNALVANAKTVEGSKELAMGVKANDTNALQAVQLLGQLNKIPQVQEVTNPALAGKVAIPMASQVSQAGLPVQAAKGGIMNGVGTIGSYSDGGQMLKGPGDGMSDNIPAIIANKQPARLADSEFVVPADVVSHLGNGSSDAGAKQLYAMMDRVRKARTGNKKQGKEIKPEKYMPA